MCVDMFLAVIMDVRVRVPVLVAMAVLMGMIVTVSTVKRDPPLPDEPYAQTDDQQDAPLRLPIVGLEL